MMRRAVVGALLLAALVAAPSASATPTLTILAPSTLDVHLSTTEGSGAATATIVVRNDAGEAAENVRFEPRGENAEDVQVTSDVDRIPAHGAIAVPLTFASSKADVSFSGALVVTTEGAVAGSVGLTVDRGKPASWWFWVVIFGPLAAALVVVLVGWLRHPSSPGQHLGDASWDFQKSWASNLTVIGGLLAAVVGSGALPADVAKSATLAGFGLFFAVLALFAPFVYAATRTRAGGFVLSFLISSLLTLWATFGQVATAYVLLAELRTSVSLPGVATWLLLAIAIVSAGLLGLYGANSITWTLEDQTRATEARAPSPGWSLL